MALKDDEIKKLHERIKGFVLLERRMAVAKKNMGRERENHERNMSQYRTRLMDAEKSIEILSRSVSAPTLAAAGARRGSTTTTSFDDEISMQRRQSIILGVDSDVAASKRRSSVGALGVEREASGGTPRGAAKRKSSMLFESPGHAALRRGSVAVAENTHPGAYSFRGDPTSDLVRSGKALLPSRPRSAYSGRELSRDHIFKRAESIAGKFARYQSAPRFRPAS